MQEIARIESFLNEHALLPPEEITNDILDELVVATNKLSQLRQKMTSEWQRHLTEVREWGLKQGQKEPSEELRHIIKNTNWQVDHCIRLSNYFSQSNTVSIKVITTAPRQKTPIHSGGEAHGRHRDNTPMAIFTALTEECTAISNDILSSNADAMGNGHEISKTTRKNAIQRRDLLMVKLSRMETTYANLMGCAQTYDIDEHRDDGIAEIKLMVNRAKTQAMMAKTMTDNLLKIRKKECDIQNIKEPNDTHEVDTTERERPSGKIRYVYAICDDKGGHCANETGRIEADIDNVVLPNNENEWGDIVREAGDAVANEMSNSRHEAPATSLMKITIERDTNEGEKEQSRASQEGLTRLRKNMPREEKYEWFARFEEITGPVQQSSKYEVENVLLQSIDQSIFEELNEDSTITTDTPISGEKDSYLSRLQKICHLDDATNIIPGK